MQIVTISKPLLNPAFFKTITRPGVHLLIIILIIRVSFIQRISRDFHLSGWLTSRMLEFGCRMFQFGCRMFVIGYKTFSVAYFQIQGIGWFSIILRIHEIEIWDVVPHHFIPVTLGPHLDFEPFVCLIITRLLASVIL